MRPARVLRLGARQALLEQRSFWRNAEYALLTFALPLVLLLLIGSTSGHGHLPGTHLKATVLLVPGIAAFGVIVAAYVNLGSKLAVLRHDGVLKRIKTTPVPSGSYLGGMLASTVATALGIAACTGLIGWLAFGVAPRLAGLGKLAAGLAAGIWCFSVLGLAISSVIRSAESATPVANASYLPLAIVSGLFDPALSLPAWLAPVVAALPVKALASLLEAGYEAGQGFPVTALLILLGWGAAGTVIVIWRFRWH